MNNDNEQAPIQSVPYGWVAWHRLGAPDFCMIPPDVSSYDRVVPVYTAPPADKLTECRHCGFYVALNRAPADAPAAPTLTDAVPQWESNLPLCPTEREMIEAMEAEIAAYRAIAAHLARKGGA